MWDVPLPSFCWEVRLYILYYIRFTLPAGPVVHCTTECCSKCHAAVSVAPTHHNATRAPQKRSPEHWKRMLHSEFLIANVFRVKEVIETPRHSGASSPEPSLPSDALQTEGARHFFASKRPWQIACIIEMSNQRNVYTLYLLNQKQTLQTNVYFSRSLYVSSLVMLALHFSEGGLFPWTKAGIARGSLNWCVLKPELFWNRPTVFRWSKSCIMCCHPICVPVAPSFSVVWPHLHPETNLIISRQYTV